MPPQKMRQRTSSIANQCNEMSILDRITAYVQHGDRVERARDPDTHEPLPSFEPTAMVKLGAWFAKTPWLRRQVLKWITAGGAVVSAWLIAHGGSEHEGAIVAGAIAAFTFLYEQGISYLCNRAKITAPAWEDDEPEPPARSLAAASPFTPVGGFTRPSFFTHPAATMTEPDTITPQPRFPKKAIPLGPKGVKIIAEQGDGCKSTVRSSDGAFVATVENHPKVVRGTLRAEADDGQVVVVQTDTGLVSLERAEWEIFVKAEQP